MAILNGANNSSSFGGSSLGYQNPAFRIKIVAANDSMEQKRGGGGRSNSFIHAGDNLKEGDPVTASVKGGKISGKIRGIEKNTEGEITYITVEDNEGNLHKVDISRIKTGNFDGSIADDIDKTTSSPGVLGEEHTQTHKNVKLFNEFINS